MSNVVWEGTGRREKASEQRQYKGGGRGSEGREGGTSLPGLPWPRRLGDALGLIRK